MKDENYRYPLVGPGRPDLETCMGHLLQLVENLNTYKVILYIDVVGNQRRYEEQHHIRDNRHHFHQFC